jgi:outer membrane protein assembly factor BamB
MFHVKRQRWLGFVLGLSLLGLLAAGCSTAAGSRGWAPPVQTDNLLMVSTDDGRLDGFDASDRTLLWRFPQSWFIEESDARDLDGIYGPPVLSGDGRTIFIGDYNGFIYAFRTEGANLAERPNAEKPRAAALKLEGPVIGGLTYNEASDTLLVTSGPHLYSVSAADLERRIGDSGVAVNAVRLFTADDNIWGAPTLSGGNVLIASLDGSLYAVDASSGALQWTFTDDGAFASSPTIVDGNALVGGFGTELYAVDASTGRSEWSFKAGNWIWSRPAVVGNQVYVGDFEGNFYALDAASGTLAWTLTLDRGPIRASPVLSGGRLIVATTEGWIGAIEPASQSIAWQRDLGTSLNADLVVQGNEVLIAPGGCVSLPGTENRIYYVSVDAQTGDLRQADNRVC